MLKNRLLMGGLFLVLIFGGVIFYQEIITPQQVIGQVKKDKPTGLEDDDEFWLELEGLEMGAEEESGRNPDPGQGMNPGQGQKMMPMMPQGGGASPMLST